jgi:anti-sigma regulatory factor (Ser/Thr protein kinase)
MRHLEGLLHPGEPRALQRLRGREHAMTAATLARPGAAGLVLPGSPESVREARAMVRRTLGRHHPAADAAAVCVSELAANAITHTRSGLPGATFAVTVEAEPGGVLIRVADDGARGMPAPAGQAPGEHGRGLQIVAALSEAWGVQQMASGRATWCRIPVPQVPAPRSGRRP